MIGSESTATIAGGSTAALWQNGSDVPSDFVAGNYFDKYRSGNPLHRTLMQRFLTTIREIVGIVQPQRVLEIGCGPGDLCREVFGLAKGSSTEYTGLDIAAEEVEKARRLLPDRCFQQGSAYDLPFAAGQFDLVVACEVFEHLERPAAALEEIHRVCKGHLLLSVPREPLWRLLNIARGKYVRRWGNTPGHVQNFSRREIRRLVETRFRVVEQRLPVPWTILLGAC